MKKLTVATVVFQEMISRALKGASQNKLIPLTGLMAIELKNGELTLTTTDGSNFLYVRQHNVEGEEFYVVVQVEQFSKLISRITSETTTLELDNSVLTVKGNGTYKIELQLDEEGNLIKYPNPLDNVQLEGNGTEVNLTTIKTILNTNKAALAVTMEIPVYTGYYVGDRVVSTDTYKICGLDVKLFDKPMLISPELMNLLDVMTEEKINVDILEDGVLVFSTSDCVVFGHEMDGIDDYAIEAISGLLDEEFESSCKVAKAELLATLDRIGLFVGTYDNKAISLTFTKEGLSIANKQSSGVEVLPYLASDNFKAYTCNIDIVMLTQQVKALSTDAVHISYGNDKSIKITEGNITQVIALLEE